MYVIDSFLQIELGKTVCLFLCRLLVKLLVMVLWTIRLSWRFDRIAAWLLVPYAGWVAFASLLNAAKSVGTAGRRPETPAR